MNNYNPHHSQSEFPTQTASSQRFGGQSSPSQANSYNHIHGHQSSFEAQRQDTFEAHSLAMNTGLPSLQSHRSYQSHAPTYPDQRHYHSTSSDYGQQSQSQGRQVLNNLQPTMANHFRSVQAPRLQQSQVHDQHEANRIDHFSLVNQHHVLPVDSLDPRTSLIQQRSTHQQISTADLRPPESSQRHNKGRNRREAPRLHPRSEATSVPTLSSTPQVQEPSTTRAIVNSFLPNSLRGESQSSLPSTLPTPDEMMKKSSVQLRMLASKHAKNKKVSSLPHDLQGYFMDLYDEFDKVLAINCINHQVSVASVHQLWYDSSLQSWKYTYQTLTYNSTGAKRQHGEGQTAGNGTIKVKRLEKYTEIVSRLTLLMIYTW